MLNPVEQPVFGLLVPGQWGEHATLRKFPFLREFTRVEQEPADEDLPLVADWQRHIPALAPRARECPLRGGLHSQGVFEVYVDLGEDETPSAGQTATFAAFLAAEEQVCRNLVDAILRYYRTARREIPDYFDRPTPDDGEFPDDHDATTLARVLEFDCVHIPPTVVAGAAPMTFSWRPAWDEEHGLLSLVYEGQVLIVGTDEVRELESAPSDEWFNSLWNRSMMTPAELAAYEAYRRGHEGAGPSA